ncbi:PREDICTED: cytochrome P450 2C29-like [Ceratotherium simum simum]|uniref:Cytochrome P450 2C29-like n=1 Tax=Ceratotherium simum simum TaxID=73337 RepID=A0ABM1DII5_CERSS|nr:PREDICTED: cytochrome P450 2C29-like [Ceratotherium simum simum]
MLGDQGIRSSQPSLAPAKVQAELDAVVGRMRAPCLEDRGRLPYTNTVLHEIQHFITVLPLGMPRAVTCDTHLHGHFLPKGTSVIPLLASAHRDPTQFTDPDCFNPANFLNDKGEFQSNDAFMPFASGPSQAGRGPAWTGPGAHGVLIPHPCVPRKANVPGCRPGQIRDVPLPHYHPAAVPPAPCGEPHWPHPTAH